MKRLVAVAVCALIGLLSLAQPAWAILTSDSTNIGAHPSYGTSWSSFWRTNSDYSMLTDGNGTFINAPGTSGNSRSIMFRLNNSCPFQRCVTDPYGFSSMAYIDAHANFNIAGTITAEMGNGGSGKFLADSVEISLVDSHSNTVFDVVSTGDLTISGTGSKPGGGMWASTSDIRTKRNEAPFTRGLEVLNRIHPVSYEYNGLGGERATGVRYVGVNAQDLEPLAPSMISTRKGKLRPTDAEETDIKQVNPSEFVYLLINAVNQQQRQIESLRAEVNQLKARPNR
jgi:hypothetical protein